MELTGLSMEAVLGVLGGFGAAVIALYLLKLRRRRIAVPFVKLWEQVLAERQTTRLFSQLRRLFSLLIALAVVAVLALALGDPRPAGARSEGRTLVLLLDASASMQALDVEPSRFEVARQRARVLARELGPNDRMLVAQLDAVSTPLSPLTDEPRILLDAIDRAGVTDLQAELAPGLRLALDVLRDAPGPEIVLISDGALPPAEAMQARLVEQDVRLSWERVGIGERNLAITAFAVRRYPLDKSQSEVLVEVFNPTEEEETVELTLLGDGEVVDIQRLTIHPGEHLRRFFGQISGVDQRMEARLTLAEGGRDLLAVDDAAFARLPERRRARVLVVTRGNLYLEAALLLDEYLDVFDVTPEAYPPEEAYDLVIFDSCLPPTPPDRPALYLYPESSEAMPGPLEIVGRVQNPFFETLDRRHPLLQWTALGDVNVAEALAVRPEPEDRVVAGSRDAPLIVEGSRGGHRFVALTFDLRASDLPLRVAWPLFLLNTIDRFVQEDGGYVSSYQTGDTWHIPAPASEEEVTIVDPDGIESRAPVVQGRAIVAGRRAGFYTLRGAGGEETVFAANLGSEVESTLEPVEQLRVGDLRAGSTSRAEAGLRREIWLYLVLFALLVLTLEWFTYHRRWTV